MLFFTPEDLEVQGVSCDGASKITFKNKVFIRHLDFSSKARQAAITVCQEYLDSDLQCFIVENRAYLTLWIEEKQESLEGETEGLLMNHRQPEFNGSSYRVEAKSEESKSFLMDRGQLKAISHSAQTEAKSDVPVQTGINSKNSSSDQLSRQSLPDLPSKDEEPSKHSSPIKPIDHSESVPSSQPSPEDKASTKKRPPKRYRGVSY